MCGMGIKYYISDNSSSNKEFYTFDAHIDGFFSDNQWNLFRKRIEKGLLSKDASNYVQSIVTFY